MCGYNGCVNCGKCGKPRIQPKMIRCLKCGADVTAHMDSPTCPHCGSPLPPPPGAAMRK